MMDKNKLSEINEIYHELELKHMDLMNALSHRTFECSGAWVSGCLDENDNEDGASRELSCPFPLIIVHGVCGVETHFDEIIVISKLQRDEALVRTYNKFKKYSFDVRSAEEHCIKLYDKEDPLEYLKVALDDSEDEEFEFHFRFPFDTDSKTIFEFAKLLRREGFEVYE